MSFELTKELINKLLECDAEARFVFKLILEQFKDEIVGKLDRSSFNDNEKQKIKRGVSKLIKSDIITPLERSYFLINPYQVYYNKDIKYKGETKSQYLFRINHLTSFSPNTDETYPFKIKWDYVKKNYKIYKTKTLNVYTNDYLIDIPLLLNDIDQEHVKEDFYYQVFTNLEFRKEIYETDDHFESIVVEELNEGYEDLEESIKMYIKYSKMKATDLLSADFQFERFQRFLSHSLDDFITTYYIRRRIYDYIRHIQPMYMLDGYIRNKYDLFEKNFA